MKLITRSQFLFQTEKQLRNFEKTNQLEKLDSISKTILTKEFWNAVKLEDLQPFGVTALRSCLKRGFGRLEVSREYRFADEPTRLRYRSERCRVA